MELENAGKNIHVKIEINVYNFTVDNIVFKGQVTVELNYKIRVDRFSNRKEKFEMICFKQFFKIKVIKVR